MSYALAIAPEAEADLTRLIESLPRGRRDRAWDAVRGELNKLAANPGLAVRSTLDRPTYRFRFVLDNVGYHWGATFRYAADEQTIVITHIFRIPL